MTSTTFSGRLAAPRPILVLLLVAAVLAALVGLAVFAGSRADQPVIHSGLTANGRIVAVDDSGALMSYAADGSDPRQLATLPAGTQGISMSPDGTRIAYKRVFPPVGIEIRRLSDQFVVDIVPHVEDIQDDAPSWSPDGASIAFTATIGGADRLFVAASEGSDALDRTPASVTAAQRIWRPTYSPDGSMIAFTVAPTGADDGQLFVMRTDGSGVRPLPTKPVSAGDAGGPDWSPDPHVQLIAYETLVADALTLRVFDVATGIDHNAGTGFWPSWSPDGSRIALGGEVFPTDGILAGTAASVYAFVPFTSYCNEYTGGPGISTCSHAVWSPDGTRLMAVDITGGALLIGTADGSLKTPTRIPLGIGLDRPIGPYVWQPIWQ
jgi:Tol biopolymer transport system component